MPATDREWSSDDYERFVKVITPIVQDHPRGLPRFESKNSGAIMLRVVSVQNLAILHDPNLSLATRLAQGVALSQTSAAVLSSYAEATGKGEVFDRELVELMVFVVKLNNELWTIADEVLETLTPEERVDRASALDKMRSGSAQIAMGTLTTLDEVKVYRLSELRRLAIQLRPIFPALVQRLTAEAHAEVVTRLRALASQPSREDDLPSLLKGLLDAIEPNAKSGA